MEDTDITKNDICAKNFYIENSYGDSICSRATFYSWKNGKYVPKNISTIEQVCKLFADKIDSSKIYTLKNHVLKLNYRDKK